MTFTYGPIDPNHWKPYMDDHMREKMEELAEQVENDLHVDWDWLRKYDDFTDVVYELVQAGYLLKFDE